MYEEHFWSDLHLGHWSALKHRGWFATLAEYHAHVRACWLSRVKPGDKIWLVGDIALTWEGLMVLKDLPGFKILVLGNHDDERELDIRMLLEVFDEIRGFVKHRHGFYIGHAPIHAMSLRGRRCIHGHEHDRVINDPRYINVSIDHLFDGPTTMNKIRSGEYRSYQPELPITEMSEEVQ